MNQKAIVDQIKGEIDSFLEKSKEKQKMLIKV